MSVPTITSIAPSSGPAAGGTQVSIAGSGLSSVTSVLFDDTPSPDISSVSDTLLEVMSPAGPVGTTTISVITPNGNAIWFDAFQYLVSVDSVFPVSGPMAGGTSVDIKGSGLLEIHGITFDDTPATNFIVKSDTLITVVTPPAAAAGQATLSFLDLHGNPVYIDFFAFTYEAASAAAANQSGAGAGDGSSSQGTTTQPAKGTDPGTTPTDGAPAKQGTTPDPAKPKQAAPKQSPPDSPPQDPNKQDTPAPGGSDPKSAPKTTTPDPAAPGKGATPAPSDATPPKPSAPPAPTGPTPSPDYIPGGRMIVPEGKTGLGGTAGTGQGFGVGTLMAGGGGSAAPSNLPYYVDPALTGQLVQSLIGLVQNAASPDALEAQNIILRRLALEGDVIGSRIPPPRNISEIGGYINLLATLKEKSIREQAIAGILGVAGPPQPLGWVSNTQPLSMVPVTNDRPPVAAQRSFPLTTLVRSDFVSGVQSALKTLHSYGATLPLTSPSVIVLPKGGTGVPVPSNILLYLGRVLTIAPSAGLINPAADPIALIAPAAPGQDFALAAQVLNAATFKVPPADLQAVECTPTSKTIVPVTQVSVVPIAPILAAAGYYSSAPFPVPANSTVTSWAQLVNTTGLVAGQTELGDELSLLYRQDQIAGSVFAAMLTWKWNGAAFAP